MNLLRFLKILVYSTILLVGILAPTPALAKDEAGAAAILSMERMDLPQSTAAGVALVEARSGTVLLSVNGNEPLPPASTGKILTALLALDLVEDLDRSYTISPAAAAVEESLSLIHIYRWRTMRSQQKLARAVPLILPAYRLWNKVLI